MMYQQKSIIVLKKFLIIYVYHEWSLVKNLVSLMLSHPYDILYSEIQIPTHDIQVVFMNLNC